MTEELNPTTNQAAKPKNYLVESILATIFCCLPLGIVGIVFASQVNSKYDTGDYAGAEKASKQARQFIIWSIITWVVILVAYLAFFGTTLMAILNSAQ